MLQKLLNIIASHVDGLKPLIPEDRFPIVSILNEVSDNIVFSSPIDGEDAFYRPAFVNFQAAFELAAAQLMESDDYTCTAIIHTPGLVKPLTLHAPDKEFLERSVAPEIAADDARLDTVKIRGEKALPAFMNAGGIVIAAATNTNLAPDQKEYFEIHQKEFGEQLVTRKLDALAKEMVGASYILKNNETGEVTFAFIRASQSDVTDPRPWIFGIGSPEDKAIAKQYKETMKHFGALIPQAA